MELSITSATRRDILECQKYTTHSHFIQSIKKSSCCKQSKSMPKLCAQRGWETAAESQRENHNNTLFVSPLALRQLLPFTKKKTKKQGGVSRQAGYVAHPFQIHNCVHVKVHSLSDCFHISCVHTSARRLRAGMEVQVCVEPRLAECVQTLPIKVHETAHPM